MRLGLAVVVASLSLLPPPAQELSARQQEFFTSYKNLVELQDLRGINQLVAKDMRGRESTTEGVLDQYCFKFVLTGDEAKLEEVRLLATAADQVEHSGSQAGRFAKRFELLKSLEPDQRRAWGVMRTEWSKAASTFITAQQKKEQSEFRRALVELEQVRASAVELKDLEIEAVSIYNIGICHENLGDPDEVVKAFDKGMDVWVASGRAKDVMYQYMMDKRADLMEKQARSEVDNANAGGATGEKKSSTTSYKDGSEWQEWTTEYREMKDPNTPGSTSPWCTDHLLLWRDFSWSEGAHPFGLLVRASPFGKELSLVREGSKGFFDVDGDKKESKADSPVKVIDGKPTLNVVRSGEGKDADSYAFFMLTGGQSQSWFQASVNFGTKGLYRVGCYREGKILGETILFLDDNANGTLGDASEQRDNLLRDAPAWMDVDGLVVGKGRPMPWSDVIQVAGQWHALKLVDPHAKKLRTRELDIQTGSVVLKWDGPVQPKMLVLAEIRDFKGSFFDVAGGKPVTVPVGRYEIAYGRIESGKGAQTKQAWIFKGDAQPIEVTAGETTTLEMGAPYTFDFEAKDQGKGLLIKGKNVLIKEKSGAIVGRIYDDVPLPEVTMRAKGGATIGKPATMAKASIEQRNEDNSAAWFPSDLELKKAEKQEVEVQLNLKKPHPLLGGPFKSDWK
jgi:hypothetical protein